MPLVPLLALLGCVNIGPGPDDTVSHSGSDDDTGCYGDDLPSPQIERATVDVSDGTWSFDVMLAGWMGSTTLHIAQTDTTEEPPWAELGHTFPRTTNFEDSGGEDTRGTYDPDACWDNPYLELEIVPTPGQVVPGETTLFTAEQRDALTFVVEISDTAGAFADCVTWGHAPGAIVADFDFSDCRPL